MRTLASLKLTLVGFIGLVLGVLHYYLNGAEQYWLVAPLLLLAVNLFAALISNPRFRRQGGLLVFHIGLLMLLVLVALGQLLGFSGRVEIVEGQSFQDARVQATREGPWHGRAALERIDFTQGPFQVSYAPSLVRGNTEASVLTSGPASGQRVSRFGDSVPLHLSGYDFYTTPNKGYALLLTWFGQEAEPVTGAVHLPSYPLHDWNQTAAWRAPNGTLIEFELDLPAAVPERSAWVLDSRNASGSLTVRTPDSEYRLKAGQTIAVSGGRLRLEAVRMWLGYEIWHDPTLSWLLAAALIAVLGLAWHYWGKLWSRPLPGNATATRAVRGGPPEEVVLGA